MESIPGSSRVSAKIGLARREIFELLKNNLNANMTEIYSKIEEIMSCKLQLVYAIDDLSKQTIRKLIFDLNERWQKCQRKQSRFLAAHRKWLEVFISFAGEENAAESVETDISDRGRPPLDFADVSDRSKRRKTRHLRSHATEELSYAAQMKLRAEGKTDAAKVVKDVTLGTPTKAKKYIKSFELINTSEIFTADEALSLFIELNFSRHKYQQLRNACLRKKSKLFPPYKQISKSKMHCYPKSTIIVNEYSAEVKLQPLLDHTISRILLHQLDVIKSLNNEQCENLILICKWGCDGSSGHSVYKQKFNEDPDKTDESIFFTSVVPLQLVHINESANSTIVVWKNPRPSSTRFCRPIKIQFLHETTAITQQETNYIQKQVDELLLFETVIDGQKICVKYRLALTMIDGKVCNAITSTSSMQRCYLCQATSKDFNDLDFILSKQINEKHLEFGLSSLHVWIRCFEFCLHLSYKLEIKKWQGRSNEDKESIQTRKETVQKDFKTQLGLIVDRPKVGYGSTNDGNTARRFFENTASSARITGVDEDLIHRFHIILQAISSGYNINIDNYKSYAIETAKKYVQIYSWYYMPTSIHKLLVHGSEIIAHSLLPIGQMSEDAQESCNKFFKKFRQDFSRKYSRTKTMEDIFLRFLVTSDPYVSSCRQLPLKPLKSLSAEVVGLLLPPFGQLHGNSFPAEDIVSTSDSSSDTDTSENYSSDDDGKNFLL